MHSFLFLLFSSLLPFCVAKPTIPAFLIDYDEIMGHLRIESNPFSKSSGPVFADIIQDTINQCSVLILFVEETLSTEDISIKDRRGSPFRYLHENVIANKVKYMPNVLSPVKIMTRLLPPTQSNVFVLDIDRKFQPSDSFRYFYVFFSDDQYKYINESRIDMLRRHDKIMQQVYVITRKAASGAVVGIYTGKVNPVVVIRPEFVPALGDSNALEQGTILASADALFRFKDMSVDFGDRMRRTSFLEEPLTIKSEKRTHESTTTLVASDAGFVLEFTFVFFDTYWSLNCIKLMESNETVGETFPIDVAAPYNRSFYCDEALVIYNEVAKSTIWIPEYQMQAFRKRARSSQSATGDTTTTTEYPEEKIDAFGEPVFCNRYFNIPLISGLLVTAMFLGIIGVGVYALYNCHTNDGYDDPHGKPLVIGSTD